MKTDFEVVWILNKTKGLTLTPRDDESMIEFTRWLLQTHELMNQTILEKEKWVKSEEIKITFSEEKAKSK